MTPVEGSDRGALRVHYVANVRIPSERANAYQILMQCDALAARGVALTLVAPRRRNRFTLEDQDIPRHFGTRAAPRIERLATIDWIERVPPGLQRLPFMLQSWTFARSVRRFLRERPCDVVYSRDPWSLLALEHAPVPVVYEAHDLPRRDAARAALRRALIRQPAVVAITEGLRADLAAMGVAPERIAVLPDAVDLERFRDLPAPAAARARLGIPEGSPLVVYAGHLFPWKGADVLVEAAAGAGFRLLLVGGRPGDRARIGALIGRLGATNVTLHEPVEPARVPMFLAAADVLALPNSGRERISARYTSPLKLFEYLAAERPVVASDLPSLREILTDGTNARLVAPDDPRALRAGIEDCIARPAPARERAAAGRRAVEAYTWDARAARIADLLRGVVRRTA